MKKLLSLSWNPHRVVLVDVSTGQYDVVVEDAGPYPDGVTFDGQDIYWTTMGEPTPADNAEGADFTAKNGSVQAIRLDGSQRRTVVPAGGTTTGKQIVLDAQGRLHWGNREGFALSSCLKDGRDLRDDVAYSGSNGLLDWVVGVAVDEANGHIYWSQKGTYAGGDGRIMRAGLSIPEGETASSRTDIETLWDHLPGPIDLEIMNGRLYWTDRNANSLFCADLPAAGEAGGDITQLADGFDETIGLAVDVDTHVAYVSDLGGRIHVVPAPGHGTRQRTILVDPQISLTGLKLIDI